MKFHFDDATKVISHWMLQDEEVALAIAATDDFKKDATTIAEVRVNGVLLNFESLEAFLDYQVQCAIEDAEKRFANLDAEVERRLNKRLEQEAQKVLDKMDNLREALEDASSIIKPYWDN